MHCIPLFFWYQMRHCDAVSLLKLPVFLKARPHARTALWIGRGMEATLQQTKSSAARAAERLVQFDCDAGAQRFLVGFFSKRRRVASAK